MYGDKERSNLQVIYLYIFSLQLYMKLAFFGLFSAIWACVRSGLAVYCQFYLYKYLAAMLNATWSTPTGKKITHEHIFCYL